MAKTRMTPDAALATDDAIRTRIAMLEAQLKTETNPTDIRQTNGRIRGLKSRLSVGPAEKTASNPNLLISKSDLE
jgi:hypothetical protein